MLGTNIGKPHVANGAFVTEDLALLMDVLCTPSLASLTPTAPGMVLQLQRPTKKTLAEYLL
jgi:hypothetical protein